MSSVPHFLTLRLAQVYIGEVSVYETYHTRILFFKRYVPVLYVTYSILAHAYPRVMLVMIIFEKVRSPVQ